MSFIYAIFEKKKKFIFFYKESTKTFLWWAFILHKIDLTEYNKLLRGNKGEYKEEMNV